MTTIAETEADLGPIPRSDPPFMRRVRIHQAWYRYHGLGIDTYGNLANSGKPCGSVLPPEHASRGANFVNDVARATYELRRAAGWGVDPVRCTSYMTSSQTLTFNAFSGVVQRPVPAARLVSALLGRNDFLRLEAAEFEYSAVSSPYWIGDRTFVDLLLRFRRTDGGRVMVTRRSRAWHGSGSIWTPTSRAIALGR
jgi:hypothetical protein